MDCFVPVVVEDVEVADVVVGVVVSVVDEVLVAEVVVSVDVDVVGVVDVVEVSTRNRTPMSDIEETELLTVAYNPALCENLMEIRSCHQPRLCLQQSTAVLLLVYLL